MPSVANKILQRLQGLVWGDGVKDSAVYFDGHQLVVDLVGQTNGAGGLVVRGLDAQNRAVELFRINKDGQGGVGTGGALVNTSRMFFVGGSFVGPAGGGAIGLGVGPTLTVPDGGDGGGIYVDAVVRSGVSVQNGHLYGMMIQPNFVNLGAGSLNIEALFLRQYDVSGLGFANAYGLIVDSPIGATNNYSIQNSGIIQMRGASALYFQQIAGTTDSLIAGATGPDVYVTGASVGDLVIRFPNTQKLLVSPDGGTTPYLIVSEGTGVKVSNQATSSTVLTLQTRTAGYGVGIQFRQPAGSGFYNWIAGSQVHANDEYAIVPSTAADGSTFTNPAIKMSRQGVVQVPGTLYAASGQAVVANGNSASFFGLGNTTYSDFGIFFGSGPPVVQARKGSWYMREDGTGTNDRMYIATGDDAGDGHTIWTAVVTVA